ncbi:hypothetical protein DNTS_021613 [Danionella cerebrum]|uniref:RING-type E3 ubiquitin transferase n=1 Tax=Danionella cerebrum TaxID=2873325 RepID=A0A553QXP4_9TELE|nr:hypothetical protein DNTS_021613 [Danionella translucida]
MLCLITRPDSVVLEVEVDPKANGEEILNKICQKMGIIEVDYFGLQFTGSKGESLWMNLRNRISQQVDGLCPCRLRLRVKFFVEPHLILQEQTRHWFLLHVKEELLKGSLRLDAEQAVELSALLAQAEFGDYCQNTAKYCYSQIYTQDPTPSIIRRQAHFQTFDLEIRKVLYRGTRRWRALVRHRPNTRPYSWFLPSASMVWNGTQHGTLRDRSYSSGLDQRDSLSAQQTSHLLKGTFVTITYPVIQMATQSGRNVYVTITKDSGDSVVLLFKFLSPSAANGLYRAITEIHAFYRCDTVMSTVKMQYSRDFKGHLASLFLNESIDVGKRYIFDIQRTSKEVYDRTRRALFNAAGTGVSRGGADVSPGHSLQRRTEAERDERMCAGCRETDALKEKLQRLQEALTCALCCEREISAVFCPCGHVFCCYSCASQLQSCPVCRSDVERVQHVYLPTCTSLLSLGETKTTSCRQPTGPAISEDWASKENPCHM